MKNKIYLVSCDSKLIFSDFTELIKSRVPGVFAKDYSDYKFDILKNIFMNNFSKYNQKDVKFLEGISDKINKYNNSIFNLVLNNINEVNYKGVYIFIRVPEIKDINRFKRAIKKPNYKTVRLNNTLDITKKLALEYKKYKFDSRIQYVDSVQLKHQVKKFIMTHIPTFKKIRG